MKLDKEIKEKWPELSTREGVIFHQDNARPHTVPVRIVRPPVFDNCLNYPNLNYISEKICSLH